MRFIIFALLIPTLLIIGKPEVKQKREQTKTIWKQKLNNSTADNVEKHDTWFMNDLTVKL